MTRLRLLLLTCATALATASGAAAAGPTGEYVVVLKDGADAAVLAERHKKTYGAHAFDVYRHAVSGYAATVPAASVAALRKDPNVRFVVEDREFVEGAQTLPTGVDRIDGDLSSTRSGDGAGTVPVNVAVLDTGVDGTHPDLEVVGGVNCLKKRADGKKATEDPSGHGTAVAGIIAARDNGLGVVGVAPGARIWSVRVLDKKGRGSLSSVVCGVDWVASTRADSDASNDVVVANMSLGSPGGDDGRCGTASGDVLHSAVCRAVAAGVTIVASAQNDGADIAGIVPAAYDEVLTVTAMADFDGRPGGRARQTCEPDYSFADDAFAFFSNFASSADRNHTLAAPGVCIPTTGTGGVYATRTGTSFAAPHVAGTAALCIARGRCTSPAQTLRRLIDDAAAYTNANPSYGFRGDPLRPEAGKYFGYLVRAGLY